MKRIAIFGASGYLGTYLVDVARKFGFEPISFVRVNSTISTQLENNSEIRLVDVTSPSTLIGQLDDCDYVISTVGITRQKDGLSYDDIDYQANMNILCEAQSAGISKFMYTSVFKGAEHQEVRLCEAKERFVKQLQVSGIDYCVVRPTGFFSDMLAFLQMAQKGSVHLFDQGKQRINPIHGQDLAEAMINLFRIGLPSFIQNEVPIGGPKIFTYRQIAEQAFSVIGQPTKVRYYPDWLRRCAIFMGKKCLSESSFGPYEFFLTFAAVEMVAPKYGSHQLEAFFAESKRGQS